MLIYSAKLYECEIYSNTELTQNIYITRFVNRDLILNCYPGQFINLRVNDSLTPLLRRPFSICQVNEKEGWFEILWQVSGQGTAIMKNYQAGDKVNVLGPLGSGFKIPVKINNAILVGGGLGLAPLPFLCKKLLEKKIRVEIFVGVRTGADLAMMTPFAPFDVPVEVTTEDGSSGSKGFVTVPLLQKLQNLRDKQTTQIFACGPTGLLKKMSTISDEYEIPVQVSIETVMGCGFGICVGCPVRMRNPAVGEDLYKLSCMDGPVFDTKEIILNG